MAEWHRHQGMTARQMLDMPPVWLMGCIALVWVQQAVAPGLNTLHPVLRVVGAVLFWCGLALICWTIWTFMRKDTTAVPHQTPVRIITTGPFAFSRNPIYLGDLMVLAGVALGYGAWMMLALVPILMMILTRRFIAPEEARLKDSFGADFTAYANKTRRWI